MEIIGHRYAEFDRREFVKLTGAAGAFALLSQNALGAECVKESKVGTGLQFWLDGLHFEAAPSGSDIISNATLALFSYDHSMTAESHVESVDLIDATNGSPLATRFFRASHKTSTGKAPYVIFENITLKYASKYLVIYQVRSGEKIMVHTYELAKATRSTFGSPQVRVPITVKTGLSNSGSMAALLGSKPDYIGTITSPYIYYTKFHTGRHSARSVIQEVSTDGKFKIKIEAMHDDFNAGHFMRYFIVADPVGRLLGMIERSFPVGGGAVPHQLVTELRSNQTQIDGLKTPEDTWSEADIANINDCPYVQIITDDQYDAIARQVVRLR